jgi:hypothetical protein
VDPPLPKAAGAHAVTTISNRRWDKCFTVTILAYVDMGEGLKLSGGVTIGEYTEYHETVTCVTPS